MSKLPITSLTAAILTLTFVVLSIRVVRGRLSSKTSLGDGGKGSIATGQDATALVVARIAHPFGLGRKSPNAPRAVGFMINVIMLAAGAVYLGYLTLL